MPDKPRRKGRPKNFYGKPAATTIQSLDRAFDVLDALAANMGMTLTEIAKDLQQSPATMHRVLSTLEARNIVEIDLQTQTWHIGSMAFRLGSAFLRRSGVIERSHPVMRELMEQTGETSNLGIDMNGRVMFISQIETHETIRAFFPPGTISPMHASGIGKALLSQYSDQRIAEFLRSHALECFTDKTISAAADLQEDLLKSRQRGWAYDDEEKTTGMRCVAAPILNLFGEAVAGISVSGPTLRMSEDKIDRIGTMVRDAAERVSRSMGAPDIGAG
ncbi:Acetate operon repressor [Roseovarius litorisediminis]|uniref:Acetate operon repressor n=1 Tax=Roseovarius litorisediminis TaxID=1312363 RepID=A0A1Y5RTM4_9RHOB|nr:HTH-type transcriptional regulator BhcR [Roseovarius litorisediminis]SLN23994.1 Acetate operon repressor [Roseovarius litorisediminis]